MVHLTLAKTANEGCLSERVNGFPAAGVKDLHWLTAGSKLLFPEEFEVCGSHSLKTSSCELLLPT